MCADVSVPDQQGRDNPTNDISKDYVQSALVHLDACNAEIEQLEAHIKELKSRVNEKAYVLIKNAPSDDERKDLASEIYWLRQYIKSSTVCEALDIYPQAIKGRLYAGIVTVPCRDCGKPGDVTLSSRTHLDTVKKDGDAICDDCKKKRAETSSNFAERLRQEEIERKARVAELKAMPYREYLKTDHWQELRRRALKRSYYTCQLCNAKNTSLHVHHRTYERRGEEYISDLIVLCANCHETFHANGVLS